MSRARSRPRRAPARRRTRRCRRARRSSAACSRAPRRANSGRGLLVPPVSRPGRERGDLHAAISGENPERNLVPDVVIEAAATVRPWKPPWKTMTFGRPVACRASRSAASMASLPELAKNIRSRPGGSTSPSRSTSVQQRAVHDGRVLAVDQRADLLLRRRDHPGVAVPGAGHPDAGGEVEVAAVVLVVELDALAAGDQYRGRLFEDRREFSHVLRSLPVDGRLLTIRVSHRTGDRRRVAVNQHREARRRRGRREATIHRREMGRRGETARTFDVVDPGHRYRRCARSPTHPPPTAARPRRRRGGPAGLRRDLAAGTRPTCSPGRSSCCTSGSTTWPC